MLLWFNGEFDNFKQATEDENAGRNAKSGEGHEFVTCHFRAFSASRITADSNLVEASYYIGKNKESAKLFRHRIYEFLSSSDTPSGNTYDIVTRIYRPKKSFSKLISEIHPNNSESPLDDYEWLPQCDLGWRLNGDHFGGLLLRTPCLLPSERDPTQTMGDFSMETNL
eukprot:gene43133-57384_t